MKTNPTCGEATTRHVMKPRVVLTVKTVLNNYTRDSQLPFSDWNILFAFIENSDTACTLGPCAAKLRHSPVHFFCLFSQTGNLALLIKKFTRTDLPLVPHVSRFLE